LRYQGFPEFVKALVALGLLDDSPADYLAAEKTIDVTWKAVLTQVLGIESTSEEDIKKTVVAKAGLEGEDAKRVLHGMSWLGLFSDTKVHKKGNLLDTLCATLEEKMQYQPGERDMVMLQHKFEVELKDGTKQTRTTTGLWFGIPNGDTAMATTVGVPCAIATQLILDGKITTTGVIAPMEDEVVNPLLTALEAEGIRMEEEIL